MKRLIKQLIRETLFFEVMQPNIHEPFIENGEHNYIVIATDDENEDEYYLVLNVSLLRLSDIRSELSFGIYIVSKDLTKTSKYFYTREEVNKYLPNELRGKVMPLVNEMSKNLITRINPKSIEMQTAEKLSGDSLKRYEKIIEMLTNELGYIKINDYKKDGIHYWVFNRNDKEEVFNEETILTYEIIPIDDKIKRIEESLKKHNFLESLKNNIK